MQLVNKVKNAIKAKTQNMKMTKDNMQLLTELENKVISIFHDGFFNFPGKLGVDIFSEDL